MFVILLMTRIPSSLTKWLLYFQCITEGFCSILVIIQTNTENFAPKSNRTPVNPVLCYLLQSGALSVGFRVMLYCIILGQSADRFLALVYPKTYRVRAKYYLIFFSIFTTIYSVISSIPSIIKVIVIEGSCHPRALPINPYLLIALETALRFLIPICALIPANIVVIQKLFHMQSVTTRNSNISQPLENNGISERTRMRSSSDPLASLQKSLLFNTLGICLQMVIVESTFLTLKILNFFGIVRYDAGAVIRGYFMCTVILLDSLFPILSILTIQVLRNTAAEHWDFIYRFRLK